MVLLFLIKNSKTSPTSLPTLFDFLNLEFDLTVGFENIKYEIYGGI